MAKHKIVRQIFSSIMGFLLTFWGAEALSFQQDPSTQVSMTEVFRQAGFELESLDVQFQMKGEYHGDRFAMIHVVPGLTELKLRLKVMGRWSQDLPKERRKRQIKVPLKVELHRLGAVESFQSWVKRQKKKGSWKESNWKNEFWVKKRGGKVVEAHLFRVNVKIPEKLDPKEGFEFSLPESLDFPSARKNRWSNTIYVFDVQKEKLVKSSQRGWMVTFKLARMHSRGENLRQLVRILYQVGVLNESSAKRWWIRVQYFELLERKLALNTAYRRRKKNNKLSPQWKQMYDKQIEMLDRALKRISS